MAVKMKYYGLLVAVTIALLACEHVAMAQFESPVTPLWHFAVRAADNSVVFVILDKDYKTPGGKGPFSIDNYVVEKSATSSFASYTVVPGPYIDSGTSYLSLDAGFTGPRPWYRVRIKGANNTVIATSEPSQPLEQKGNTFVVNGGANDPTIPCGDLAANPCPDIKTALSTAPAGTTVYITPGRYAGVNNTNLSYGGKALRVQSTNGYLLTLINCTDPITGQKTRGFNFQTGEGRDSILSGVTIASGAADTGGCMLINNASPTILDSLFLACNATTGDSRGGAIYAFAAANPGPLIRNTQFIFNWGSEGCAIYAGGSSNLTIESSSFEWGICPTAVGRGGAVSADLADITIKDTTMKNGIVGFSGGAVMIERGHAELINITAFNNTAGNYGGAFLLFGASMNITNSRVDGNTGNIFAGGVIASTADYIAINTTHNNNVGRVGGGGVKLLGGKLILKGCQVNGNTATYGGGFDLSWQTTVSTDILIEDTTVENNIVSDRGAGFYFDNHNSLIFRNVLLRNNTAAKGGGGWCTAPTLSQLYNTTFEGNTAEYGGGLFADSKCIMRMDGVVFRKNIAVEAGAGLAATDGVLMNITRSLFDANGVSDCATTNSPSLGGGIIVGLEQFDVNRQCGQAVVAKSALINIKESSLVGNLAQSKGGGLLVESGVVNVVGSEFDSNRALGTLDGGEGVAGGIGVIERCPIGNDCTTAIVTVQDSNIVQNFAMSAGGGLHFAGSSKNGSLTVSKTNFTSNSVEVSDDKTRPVDGVGGGIFVGRTNFTLSDIQMTNNEAYYGGGLYIATNLNTATTKLTKLSVNSNRAIMGPAAFWLRSSSPEFALPVNAFNFVQPDPNNTAIATEVLQVAYSTKPPTIVQSAEDVSTFSVALLDYYGNIGLAELGTCAVTAPLAAAASGNTSDIVSVRPQGSDTGVTRGGAVFAQLEVTGTIGNTYILQVDCTPNVLGRSRYLNLTGEALPALSLPVEMAPCAPGKEPKSTGSGSICVECPFNTFNTDGKQCLPCPDGAFCGGGSQVSSKPNWWRSELTSDQFYACRNPDICLPGEVAGNEACLDGQEGPLCAVCEEDWFFFAGKCENCDRGGQAYAMLVLFIIVMIIVVVMLFGRSWEFGQPGTPGIMTKIKILLAHFQILALFRDYDVLWPSATGQGFSWFDTLNIGMNMMAPECFFGSGYNFWVRWITQMLLPILAVGFSIGLYFVADYLLKRRTKNANPAFLTETSPEPEALAQAEAEASEEGAGTSATKAAPAATPEEEKARGKYHRINEYLISLKVRCWKNSFWLVTLLYPRSSMTALQMFGTQKLDVGTYLTADYSILVKPPGEGYTGTYKGYLVPGVIMLIVFAVVIPASWFYVIWKNRRNLDDPMVARKYGFLYGSYARNLPWWETAETLRKFSFAFIPVFIKPNSVGSVQGTLAQIVSVGYLMATVWLKPFALAEDNNITIASQVVLFLVLLSGCTAKWAGMSEAALRGLAAAQLLLSSSVAFCGIVLIALTIKKKVKHYKAKKEAKKADGSNSGKTGTSSSGFMVNVQAGPADDSNDASNDQTGDGNAQEGAQRFQIGATLAKYMPWAFGRRRAVADDSQNTANAREESQATDNNAATDGNQDTDTSQRQP